MARSTRPFAARMLDPHDGAEADRIAAAAGAHGVYVRNALRDGTGETLALYGTDALLGLCWFGPRGNLIVLQVEDLDGDAVADAIGGTRLPWRIALGPAACVDALLDRVRTRPLVHRDQCYYAALPTDAPRRLLRDDVRPPVRADLPALVAAALALNESDLRVDPRRVDRAWLRETVSQRIAEGSTRVIAAGGRLLSKLDFGSSGPGGSVLEGVFTFPEARGRGLCAGLVATVIAESRHVPVCLHVAADNAPARAAYAAAGMRETGRCRLLLLG